MQYGSWKDLFAGSSAANRTVPVNVYYRNGHPLVILPKRAGPPAAYAFALYAPQTFAGKIARLAWQITLPLGFGPARHADSVLVDPESSFIRFLAQCSRGESERASKPLVSASNPGYVLPQFAILAGNPHGVAPRFIIQVFDRSRRPVAVVKAGIGSIAGELVEREADFLSRAASGSIVQGAGHIGIPKLLGRFAGGDLCAFAMEFARGSSPLPSQLSGVVPILNSWLDRKCRVRVSDLPACKRLESAAGSDPLFATIHARLWELQISPSLFHGDFVPWNIKVRPGDSNWMVLDWERGETQGPPGWDWFHYVLQTETLVRRKSGLALARVAEGVLREPAFLAYMHAAGLEKCGRAWLMAYLIYCRDVLRPKEGAPALERLLQALNTND